MTKKTYLCYIFRLKLSRYGSDWDLLKKGKLRVLIKKIIIRILNRLQLLRLFFWYPPIFRWPLAKIMDGLEVGISHTTALFSDLIKESMDSNSTAIIFPFKIVKNHNFGKRCHSDPESYYNLSDSYYITPEGEKKKIRYIRAKDFLKIRNCYRVNHIQSGKTIRSTQSNRKNIVNISYRSVNYFLKKTKKLSKIRNASLHEYDDGSQIYLPLADALIKKIELVSETLGKYYLLRVRLPWDDNTPYSSEKLKKGIISWGDQKSYVTLQDWTYAESLREKLVKVFPEGSNLYIMSNLWPPFDEDYFGPLRRSFKVYRYCDFPELIEFTEGEKCNTAQLKLIEMQLQDRSMDSLTLDYLRPFVAIQNIQSYLN